MGTFAPRLDILPAEQKQLWPQLRAIQDLGFVLYGGTAIALRLGHRPSLDFDFFASLPLDKAQLARSLAFLGQATALQDRPDTFVVMTPANVKVSFFGGLDFGRVGEPEQTADRVLRVASLDDLMATKLKVILQRSEAKDYQDIAAMVRAGVRVDAGLAAAAELFKPTFPPSDSLRAMVYFEEGDMHRLVMEDRKTLVEAASGVRTLPTVRVTPDLAGPVQSPGH